MAEFHLVPSRDLVQHEQTVDCVCGPETHPVEKDDGTFNWLTVHNALGSLETPPLAPPAPSA